MIREDRLPQRLPVIISSAIQYEMTSIERRNMQDEDAICQWKDALSAVILQVSNPSIAWDNLGRFRHNANGETYANIYGHDIAYTIQTDNDGKNYVEIFYFDLSPEEYNLRERKYKKGVLIINESSLRSIIRESLQRILNRESID